MKIIFMGTPYFALPTLEALVRAQKREPALSSTPCKSQETFTGAIEVVAVYSQPPRPAGRGQKETHSPVHQFAAANNIPVYTPTSLKSAEAQAEFATLGADIAVVVAYGLLLPKAILEAPKLGCINVHPSKLPRFRGAAPLQRTIMAGEKDTATVIMQMDVGLDTGDMLLVEPYAIPEGTTTGMLHDTLSARAGALVLKTLEGLQAGTITPIKQPEEGVCYAPKISKEECRIDWNQSAETIARQIRGLSPTPGAYFEHKGENIKIFAADFTADNSEKPAGTILDNELAIACEQGTLHPTELQRAGKKRLPVAEFLKGFSA